ncbi:hypothetical protein [Vagococcus lutrae]|uniref:hypothetical protein n=1 Tax=Vagococcus lutrae TaxID=81947 RepID=UPI00288D7250|nr:hypothetical protein [Vagococcus lutrae]MDT2808387.1 hypothetical protein [Vagococcus lutrae]
MNSLYRELLQSGISISDIEETEFELLMDVVSTKKEKKKEVIPLHEFAKNL